MTIISNPDDPVTDPNIVCTRQTKIDKCNDPTLPESFERSYRLYHYDKSALTAELTYTYGLLRSVIVNASDHIVCFSPPKSLSTNVIMY